MFRENWEEAFPEQEQTTQSTPKTSEDLDVLGLLRKYEHMDKLKKHAADEIERLRAENQRLEEARFDLQASDFHCWVCADFLPTARRPTDIHRLKEEEKSVPEEYGVFGHKEGGAP